MFKVSLFDSKRFSVWLQQTESGLRVWSRIVPMVEIDWATLGIIDKTRPPHQELLWKTTSDLLTPQWKMVRFDWASLKQWRSSEKTCPPHRELFCNTIFSLLPPASKMVETSRTVRIHREMTSTTAYGYPTCRKTLKFE